MILDENDYDTMPQAELLNRWLNGNEQAGKLYQERYPLQQQEK